MIFSAWNYPGFIWLTRPETSLLINSWVNQSRYCVILSSFIGPVTTTTAAVIDNSAVRKRPLFFLCYWIFLFGRRLPSSFFFFAISITFAGDYPTAAFHFRASLPITPPPSSSSVMEEEKKRSWFRPRSQIRKSPVIDFAVLFFRLQIYK